MLKVFFPLFLPHLHPYCNREKKPYYLFVDNELLVQVGGEVKEDSEIDEGDLLEVIENALNEEKGDGKGKMY